MSVQLKKQAKRLENWIKNDAIPLWVARGLNPENGANYERLLASGEVDFESNVRMRVQARQAFFYALSFDRGWCDQGKVIAQQLLANVQHHGAHPTADGGYTHMWDKNYHIVDTKQDLYDHAFFILANAWCYRAFGDKAALVEAEKLVAHLDARFGSDYGGWIEGDYKYPYRRQNPHMHLFEAFLALYDATGDSRWLARVGELFALFQTRFFDTKQQVLFEFFEEGWAQRSDAAGEVVEPGHMMEWVWLLDWYSQRTGRPVTQYTRVLYEKALALGMDKSGLLFDAVAPDGRIIDAKKRCWGITELIKASLVQIRDGDARAEAVAIKAVDDLFTYYLCADTPGSYVDQRGAHDEVVVDFAPASTLYHLIVAAVELIDHCEEINS
jgi:mannose-6-phosphate isomerase